MQIDELRAIEAFCDDETLEQSGIKDMHWGIRRWQNPDGSLTPAGRARYGKKADKIERKSMAKVERKQAKAMVSKARKEQNRLLKDEKIKEKAAKKLEETKKKVYESNDPELMKKHIDKFSPQEVQQFTNKMQSLYAINEMQRKEQADVEKAKQGKQSVLDKTADKVNSIKNLADKAVGAFDTYKKVAKAVNAVMGEDTLPDFDKEGAKKRSEEVTKKARQSKLWNMSYDDIIKNKGKLTTAELNDISERSKHLKLIDTNKVVLGYKNQSDSTSATVGKKDKFDKNKDFVTSVGKKDKFESLNTREFGKSSDNWFKVSSKFSDTPVYEQTYKNTIDKNKDFVTSLLNNDTISRYSTGKLSSNFGTSANSWTKSNTTYTDTYKKPTIETKSDARAILEKYYQNSNVSPSQVSTASKLLSKSEKKRLKNQYKKEQNSYYNELLSNNDKNKHLQSILAKSKKRGKR